MKTLHMQGHGSLKIFSLWCESMINLINRHLVKTIADMAIFLEFTSEKLLDVDTSIEALYFSMRCRWMVSGC